MAEGLNMDIDVVKEKMSNNRKSLAELMGVKRKRMKMGEKDDMEVDGGNQSMDVD
jgi:nucleolar GTP-binding protein